MVNEKDTFIRRAMIIFDGIVVSVAFILAYLVRQHFHAFYKLDIFPAVQVVTPGPSPGSISDYLVVLFFAVPLWCVMLYWNGMYRSMRTKTTPDIIWVILRSASLATITFGMVVFLFKLQFISRVFFMLFVIGSSILLLSEKIAIFSITHYVRRQGYNYRRLLVVGTGKRASNFIGKIKKHPEWGIRISGVVDDEPKRGIKKVKDIDVIGPLKDISDLLHRHVIDEVVFVVPRSRLDHIQDAISTCEVEGIRSTVAVDLFDFKIARAHQTELGGMPLITFETTFAKEWQLFVKRAIDVIVSGLAMAILSPLYLVVAAVIKLNSPGPALFIQKRIGLNGRKFVLFKFRTMYKGAHTRLSEFAKLNEMDGPVFKIKNDPRITPVGKILRKLSIDELPQLFNVFVGCMSLVGPRPPLRREVNQYDPWQRRRLSMRPGLTCLWQISGRNGIEFHDWMKLDLKYIDNWSLWLDFKILMRTVPVVLFGVGAY